jgi:hypothetical protein
MLGSHLIANTIPHCPIARGPERFNLQVLADPFPPYLPNPYTTTSLAVSIGSTDPSDPHHVTTSPNPPDRVELERSCSLDVVGKRTTTMSINQPVASPLVSDATPTALQLV